MASASFSGVTRSSSRPVAPATRRPDMMSKRGFQKNFAGEIEKAKERHCQEDGKPLKVMAFDEARFGLINWHRRRYCPPGFRPPYIVRRSYLLQMDVSVRSGGAHEWRELLSVPAGDGRRVP